MNIKSLCEVSIIQNPSEYVLEIEQYIRYVYKSNDREEMCEEVIKELKKHIFNFFIVIAEAHNGATKEELAYISEVIGVSDVENYIGTSLTDIVKHKNLFFEYIPSYLQYVKRFNNGSECVNNILTCIINLGINFAAVDMEFNEREAKVIAEYKQVMTQKLIGFYNILSNDVRKITQKGEQIEAQKKQPVRRNLNEVLAEFDELIGLEKVKTELHTLINLARINQIRKLKNLPIINVSKHLVFSGNPGTGKTTVARLLAEIYGAIGMIEKGHLVEVDRSALIGEYVGQTAKRTKEVVDSANGGVLFIDEAYSLSEGGKDDYGKEAIAVLLKEMEDNRENLVVIVAGYPELMDKFININPGLKSRFNKYILFEDYTSDELLEILKLFLGKNQYIISEELSNDILEYLKNIDKSNFANARGVRNLFEKMIEQQANRIVRLRNITTNDLRVITKEDFENAIANIA